MIQNYFIYIFLNNIQSFIQKSKELLADNNSQELNQELNYKINQIYYHIKNLSPDIEKHWLWFRALEDYIDFINKILEKQDKEDKQNKFRNILQTYLIEDFYKNRQSIILFLTRVKGLYNSKIDTGRSAQTKLLTGIGTIAFAGLSFLFNNYFGEEEI